MLLTAFTAILNCLRLSTLENLFTQVMCSVQAMMPPALAQVLVSIAERLLSSFPEDSGTRVDADPETKLPKMTQDIAGATSSRASEVNWINTLSFGQGHRKLQRNAFILSFSSTPNSYVNLTQIVSGQRVEVHG